MAKRSFHRAVAAFKRQLIETTLEQCEGNRSETARQLGLDRAHLYTLMRRLHVDSRAPIAGGAR